MNTKISFLYTDADNYKFVHSVVVNGPATEAQIDAILETLDEEEFFIPDLVGFPCDYATGYTYNEDADHPFCRLEKDDFEETSEAPTVDMTMDDVVKSFVAHAGSWEMDNSVCASFFTGTRRN